MHSFQHISPSDLLLAYLAGELDDMQELLLFRTLAESSELRAELRDHVVIDALVRHDSDTLVPPSHLKRATLDTVAALRRADAASQPRGVPFVWTRLRVAVVAVLSALSGWLIASLPLQPPAETVPAVRADHRSAPAAITPEGPAVQPPVAPEVPSAGIAARTAVPKQSTPVQAAPSGIGTRNRQSVSPKEALLSVSPKEQQTVHIGAAASAATPVSLPVFRHVEAEPVRPALSSASAWFIPSALPGRFLAELRATASLVQRTTEVDSQSDPWFNNMSVGLYYALSEHHAVGVEAGQEAFVQMYSGVDNNRPVTIEQKPVLLWAGGAYQYTAAPIEPLGGLRPFGRVLLGGTEVGPATRALVGLRYTPDTRVTLSLGAEHSLLMYRFQDSWFTSQHIGLTYGMSLSL